MSIRNKLYDIIFESDTRAGKLFDVFLIISIFLSVLVVMLDSVKQINLVYGNLLYQLEWFFTLLFTMEYCLRLWCIGRPVYYATSFYGLVDLFAILPTYFSLLFPGAQFLLVIRVLRVLRVFRVLKFVQYIGEANILLTALRESRRKIFIFLFSVLTMMVIFGSMMYLIESGVNSGFTSIPKGIYWAIVTMTTVGYGDISPQTPLGQVIASFVMVMGFSIIAVPSGIVTIEMERTRKNALSSLVCKSCSAEGHDQDAKYCKYCGHGL